MNPRPPTNEQTTTDTELVSLTADIVSAYVSNNTVVSAELPKLIEETFDALKQAEAKNAQPVKEELTPAVPIKKSISPDAITCLECGKNFKSIRKHLRTNHGLEPDEYREKWGLSPGYPVVAAEYAKKRSEMAKKIGLGQKGKKNR